MSYNPKVTRCPVCSVIKSPLAVLCRGCYRKAIATGARSTVALEAWAQIETAATPIARQDHMFIPAAIQTRIADALSDKNLSACARAVLTVLADERLPHIGSDIPIQITGLQAHWRALNEAVWPARAIKSAARDLVMDHGVPVGSSRVAGSAGYFLAVSPEDVRITIRPYLAEAFSLLKRARAFDPSATLGAITAGQQELQA